MSVVRQADDPFVCFGAKPNKGLSPRSRRDWNARGVGQGNSEKAVGEGRRESPVDTEQQKWPVGMR